MGFPDMTHKVYVYGTLRPGNSETVLIPGAMFDMGWFPAAVAIGEAPDSFIMAEVIEVDDAGLDRLDSYEGYNKSDPDASFYRRIEYQDGFIYQFNGSVGDKMPVPTGDWLDYTQMREGCNADIVARR